MPYKFAQTQPSSSQIMPDPSLLTDILISPEGLAFLACIGGLGAVSFFGNGGGNKKNKLASGRWAGALEKKTAMKLALQQMQRRKYNEAAVCMERPGSVKDGQIPLMLPDMQRGCAIMGGPGTGKSFVGNLPIIYSYIDQGLSLAIYDFKYPDLTAQIAGYAAQHGYEIYVLAPGYPESHVCNPLDFIARKDPTIMAAQFAEVLNRNFKKGDQKNSDQFFCVAADQLVQGVVQLALETDFPDLIMAQAILSLPNLTKRLEVNKDKINFLTYLTFSTLLASAQSEKTVSSIIAVAANNFTTMMKPSILSALCGKSTLPTRIEGKKLVIFGLDREKRDVLVAPVATLIDMLVNCNVAFKRKNPLALVIDEAPTINLPRIINLTFHGILKDKNSSRMTFENHKETS